ncbi:hypothetical protein F442_03825, partial [Phytophthora nicotianae P10297]
KSVAALKPPTTSVEQSAMPSPTSGRKVARCSAPGCKKQVQTRKLCKAHGGGVRCQGLNCAKLAQSRGLCVAHGGGRRCGFEGCNKLAQYKGLCLSHGGGRRCRVIGCHKFVQIRGCCKAHARRLIEEATRGSSAATVVYRYLPRPSSTPHSPGGFTSSEPDSQLSKKHYQFPSAKTQQFGCLQLQDPSAP